MQAVESRLHFANTPVFYQWRVRMWIDWLQSNHSRDTKYIVLPRLQTTHDRHDFRTIKKVSTPHAQYRISVLLIYSQIAWCSPSTLSTSASCQSTCRRGRLSISISRATICSRIPWRPVRVTSTLRRGIAGELHAHFTLAERRVQRSTARARQCVAPTDGFRRTIVCQNDVGVAGSRQWQRESRSLPLSPRPHELRIEADSKQSRGFTRTHARSHNPPTYPPTLPAPHKLTCIYLGSLDGREPSRCQYLPMLHSDKLVNGHWRSSFATARELTFFIYTADCERCRAIFWRSFPAVDLMPRWERVIFGSVNCFSPSGLNGFIHLRSVRYGLYLERRWIGLIANSWKCPLANKRSAN